MPKSLTADQWDALLQIQRTDPSCKCISKRLLNGKAPHHDFDTFIHVKGLLYKHISDASKQFLTLVIPKSWKFTILVEAHDKLGHQGNNRTYCLIKCQYYLKGMNKDIRKYIANCVLCWQDKAKVQQYPLQMTEIPDRPFDKIAIDLVTDCKMSHLRQQAHIDHNRSPNRLARSFSHPWQICRHHSHYTYKPLFTSSFVPQIHSIRQWHGI